MKLFKDSFAMKYKLILDSSRISHDSESEQWMSAGIGDPFSLFESTFMLHAIIMNNKCCTVTSKQ